MVLWKQKISAYMHYSWIAIPIELIELEIWITWRQIEGMCVSSSEKRQCNTYKTFIKDFYKP